MNAPPRLVVVLAVCHNDFHLAEKWLAWAAHLAQPAHEYRLVVWITKSFERALIERLRFQADAFPFFVEIAETPIVYEHGYTPSANYMFRTALEHCERFYPGRPILWCEADTVPMHKDWVRAIEEEYQACGKHFLGDFHDCLIPHMTGNAVYPADWRQRAPSLATLPFPNPQQGWDSKSAHEIVPQMARSKTIQQVWRPPVITDAWVQENINGTTALFHQCKDGSLIDVLCDQERIPRIPLSEPFPRPARSIGSTSGLRMEILIVTHAKDIPFLEYCISSIRKFTTGFTGVTIAVPQGDAGAFERFAGDGVKIWPYVDVPGKGMLRHLAIKCRADEICPLADAVLHIDADCMFWDHATPDDYMRDGRLLMVRERYAGIRNQNRLLWRTAVEKAIGCTPEWETMVRHPQVYHREVYGYARRIVELFTGMPFDDYVVSGQNAFPQSFCEFNVLGTVAILHFADRFEFVDYDPAVDAQECGVSMKHTQFQYLYRGERDKLVEFWSHGGIDAYRAEARRFLEGNRPGFQIK